nr:helix-turn-helix transcriptional regulator [Marinibactrum halimedae]
MSFPKRLTALRKDKGLTQQALANAVEVHITQINRYEAGDSQPTLEVIRKLAITLGVSADMLIFDEDERGPSSNDDTLRFQFETISKFEDEDKKVAQAVLEGLILKYQAKQSVRRNI